jgi:PAS domain S-box-containing protein
LFAVIQDQEGLIWIGTSFTGLNSFDSTAEQFTNYRHDDSDPNSLSSNRVISLYEDRAGTIWIGTWGGGLNAFDRETGRFTHYRHDPADSQSLSQDEIPVILEDQAGMLWIGTTQGLNRFDRKKGMFTRFLHDPANPNSLIQNLVLSLYEDRSGSLWIGTVGGLDKFDQASGQFTHYSRQDGLPGDTIYGILEDDQGHLWISTSNGLTRFNPQTETFRNYHEGDGLQSNTFAPYSAYAQSPSGEMFFGGYGGFNAFYSDQIKDNPNPPPVMITDFRLANKPVPIGGNSILQQSILDTDQLVLSHKDDVFSFEFAALNYRSPEKNRYKYKLEGFEEDWNEINSTRRFATYTNLNPGNYVFRVIAANNDGVWNEEGTSIAITITPPWWETNWFRIGLGLLVIGLLVGTYRWRVRSIEARSQELEALVQERSAALSSAENQIQTLFEKTPLGIGLATLEGNIITTNQAMMQLTGYTEPEIRQLNVSALYDDPGQRLAMLQHLQTEQSVRDFGVRLKHKDGTPFFVRLSVSVIDRAGQDILLTVVEDVTDEVQAEAALQKANSDLTTLLDSAKAITAALDVEPLLEIILEHLSRVVDYNGASIWIREGDSLVLRASRASEGADSLVGSRVTLAASPTVREIIDTAEAFIADDISKPRDLVQDDKDVFEPLFEYHYLAGSSWLGVPLVVKDQMIGVISLVYDQPGYYTRTMADLVQALASQSAVAIENARLHVQIKQVAGQEERERLARELHDSVTQTLFSASTVAEAAPGIWDKDPVTGRRYLEQLPKMLRGALAEMRTLLLELRPDSLVDQTPGQLLELLAEAARARSRANVTLKVEGDRSLPQDITIALHRIAQESLNNVAKHAEASEVNIRLICKPDRAVLQVADDGRGFDPESVPPGHLGIDIMKERAQEIGATIQIDSKPGEGTLVVASWSRATEGK